MDQSPVELTWSLSKANGALKLEASLTNRSDQPVYVVDKLVVPRAGGKFARTDAVTVMNDDAAGTVKLALAVVSGDEPSTVLTTPTFKKLAPGETFTRTLSIPHPIAAWHPDAGVNPIAATAKEAVLLVHYFVGEPARWITLASDDAQPLKVPDGHTQQLLRSKSLPLP